MRVSDFDYELPSELIAQEPLPRGESRLLVLDRQGPQRYRRIAELPSLLRPGDLLVVNDTRVIPARLAARREGGGRVELLLVERLQPAEWRCLAKPGRRLQPGARLELGGEADGESLTARVVEREGEGQVRILFCEPIEPHLDRLGHVPLPPYIRRPDHPADRERYQTVFAHRPGAIAAPTAGLHLSAALLAALREAGVLIAPLTLHVGLGTFRPVTVERVESHRMSPERYAVPPETARLVGRVRAAGGRIVAVGTTVVRTLETAASAGEGEVSAGEGTTELFIVPGFRFRVVDLLLTNFHLPRSTLLMLVSAFAGRERVLAAYREAIAGAFRFYSYGDAMLAQRSPGAA
jgi:S-adenosylmethionine:tRNA ribosyltransferase-isomerase